MIMRKSAHKDTDTPAGQVTNGFDRYPWLPQKLSDIIDRVNKQEDIKQYRFINFRDYAVHNCLLDYDAVDLMEEAFNAAREMK
jgi:hypothetical protein